MMRHQGVRPASGRRHEPIIGPLDDPRSGRALAAEPAQPAPARELGGHLKLHTLDWARGPQAQWPSGARLSVTELTQSPAPQAPRAPRPARAVSIAARATPAVRPERPRAGRRRCTLAPAARCALIRRRGRCAGGPLRPRPLPLPLPLRDMRGGARAPRDRMRGWEGAGHDSGRRALFRSFLSC
eukprot:scaffold682_cov355-Prasinococcus_capsulatus_cf.AAC.4